MIVFQGLRRPTKIFYESIPNGPAGVRATLKRMKTAALDKFSLPTVRLLALDLIHDLPQKDWHGEIKRLHNFVRDEIRYVRDIDGIETIHTPDKILELRQGDCDDKAILLASLLKVIMHPARFVAVGFKPGKFQHVYVETKIGNKWIPLETTENVNVGWHPPKIVSKIIQDI